MDYRRYCGTGKSMAWDEPVTQGRIVTKIYKLIFYASNAFYNHRKYYFYFLLAHSPPSLGDNSRSMHKPLAVHG